MTLSARTITVTFGERRVLDRLTLDVPTGEICCLIGASGSGKSTLLRVIAGLQPVDSGEVLLDGSDITHLPTHQRSIGLVFQDHALFPHLDVAGNVGFALRLRREQKAAAAARVAELLALVGLDGFERRQVASLSGGEQQRVALARALAAKPSVLLLDEPLGALDPGTHDRLAGELRQLLRAAGTTVVHVTHDHDEAALIGDRIVSIDDLQASGVTDDAGGSVPPVA